MENGRAGAFALKIMSSMALNAVLAVVVAAVAAASMCLCVRRGAVISRSRDKERIKYLTQLDLNSQAPPDIFCCAN